MSSLGLVLLFVLVLLFLLSFGNKLARLIVIALLIIGALGVSALGQNALIMAWNMARATIGQ